MTRISPFMPIPASEIGFDFDGVIADTAEAFIRLACTEHDYCSFSHEDITNFELENCLQMPRSLVEQIFTDILTDSLASGLKPMPGAVESLEWFSRTGPVTIITARPIKEPVFAWLDHYFTGPAKQKIRVVATGDHNDKVQHIHRHGLKYFIDDRAETCIQLAKEDITPYVFNQPWNRNRHDLQTVADWDAIRALVAPPQQVL